MQLLLIVQRSNGRQVPDWQRSSAGQFASVWQFTGGGTMQKPVRQTSLGGQSSVLMQPPGLVHTWLTHCVGGGHTVFAPQKRCGTHTLPEHTNPSEQSAFEPQVNGWQNPKSQRWPAGQSVSTAQLVLQVVVPQT